MPQEIQVSEDLLYRLYKAQLDHVRDFLNYESEFTVEAGRYKTIYTALGISSTVKVSRPSFRDKDYSFHDDSHDYLSSALELAEQMRGLYYENDLDGLHKLLNTPNDPNETYVDPVSRVIQLGNYASDGVATLFYELCCPALPKEY